MTIAKPKIIDVGISFYKDRECLRRCLNSLQLWDPDCLINKVVLVDGIYFGFGSNTKLSNDYSRLLISKYKEIHPDKIELYDAPYLPERQKRQKYVDIAAQHKIPFLLILDSDEYISNINWRKLAQELNRIKKNDDKEEDKLGNIYGVHMYDEFQDYYAIRRRLLFRPEHLEYHRWHNNIVRRRDLKSFGEILNIPKNLITITHSRKDCRSEERHDKQIDYEYSLQGLENQ